MPPEQQQPGQFGSGSIIKDTVNLATALMVAVHAFAVGHALVFTVPFTAGKRRFGLPEFFGVSFGFPLFATLVHPPTVGVEYVYPFWKLQFGLFLLHAIASRLSWKRKHRLEIGTTWTELVFRLRPARAVVLDAAIACTAGYWLMRVSDAIGAYLIASGITGIVSLWLILERQRREAEAAMDAQYAANVLRNHLERMRR